MAKNNLTYESLRPAVQSALRAWGQLDGNETNLLGQLILVQRKQAKGDGRQPVTLRLATNQVLFESISQLEKQEPQGARILRQRFFDKDTSLMVAHKLHLSADQVKRRQSSAIDDLTKIILENETTLREETGREMEAGLNPPTYTRLFGIEEAYQLLYGEIIKDASPWILSVVGIGGIGKTALIDLLVRKIIYTFHFERVIWLRVRPDENKENVVTALLNELAHAILPYLPNTMPYVEKSVQVRSALKSMPHLIIIDNLERSSATSNLLLQLADLAGPSKFILTTRTRVPDQIGLYTHVMQELSPASAIRLIRHHAADIGLAELAEVADTDLERIYEVIGGNPLALKMVVGLASVQSLNDILLDMVQLKNDKVEEMYRQIYWQAWRSLSQDSRTLLEIMPLAGEGGMVTEQMAMVSNLKKEALWPAIHELVNRSLLEVRGTVWERRYGIHRLTETFLQTEIIHWQE